MSEQFKFDRNRRRVKECPCGKGNADGKFVPYAGYEQYGYCHSCAKTFKPDDIDSNIEPQIRTQDFKRAHSIIPEFYVSESVITERKNFYTEFLSNKYGSQWTEEMINRYRIGSDAKWTGGTVFWQIDHINKARSGKIMLYDPITGKRVKQPSNCISWIHFELVKKSVLTHVLTDFKYRPCLFGQHLVSGLEYRNHTVGIVESESTAIEMNYIQPDILWLATGGSAASQFDQHDTRKALTGRKVVLFPDGGFYDKWAQKAKEMAQKGLNVHVSETLEIYYRQDPTKYHNADLRDIYI